MDQPNGHPCPECGAPRRPDNTPSCACTHRAAEALRDARTAQAAAAEDFDPLRIRPYVELDPKSAPPGPEGPTPGPMDGAPAQRPEDSAEPSGTDGPARPSDGTPPHTQGPHGQGPARSPLADGGVTPSPTSHPNGPTTPPYAESPRTDGAAQSPEVSPQRSVANPADSFRAEGAAPPPSPADTTMPLRPVDPDATTVLPTAPDTTALLVPPDTTALPTPLAPAASEPSVTDLRLFDGAGAPEDGAPGAAEPGGESRSRRRGVLLAAAAAACVAVVAVAGYASGLFAYEAPSRDTALPDDIRASVPDAPSSSEASTPPAGSAPGTPSAPAAPPASRPAVSSAPASPSPSASSASTSPSQSATPSPSPTSATPTGPGQAPPDKSRQNGGPTTLRLGDRGPEVTELQLRLRQLFLYDEDDDGTYDKRLEDAVRTYQYSRGIQEDDLGVYGRSTRTRLESETKEP
ncbi:peptidoglycan-binding protein [Streptomyces sp. NPDC006372]|uniref:peptidoglycan-binding domain-containing protein n=1 Tax=Streptomyces sp. NPDC006372 TaxID=3155599 RepID=UPI0033B91FC9